MKKIFSILLVPLFLAPVTKLSAQTYQGNAPGLIYSLAQYPNGGGTLESSATVPSGAVTLQFTIDPIASTFQFDSLTFQNLTLPTLTGTYAVGFGTQANVTITFNPLSFVLSAPLPSGGNNRNPVPLSPVSGFSQPTYESYYYSANTSFSGVNLTGSYSITSPAGSASGTFSDPMTDVGISILPEIQTTGYPNSLDLLSPANGYQLKLSQAGSNTLFTATADGTTISPNFLSGSSLLILAHPQLLLRSSPNPPPGRCCSAGWVSLFLGIYALVGRRTNPVQKEKGTGIF